MDSSEYLSKTFVLSPSQIERRRQSLRKFYSDGSQFVTNVKIAACAREIPRRQQETDNATECKHQLERQAEHAQKNFNEVVSKWDTAKNIKAPQKLFKMITEQKSACDQVLAEKDDIILFLKEEIRDKEEEYIQDVKKDEEDIALISDRVDSLINALSEASSVELNTIEDSIQNEYKGFVKTNVTEWEETLKSMNEVELEHEQQHDEQVKDFQDSLRRIAIQKFEEYRILKDKLERDLHALQLELRRVKSVHILNEEKLEYNYQVLKKREEEDVALKMEQKRNIARLRDAANALRKQLLVAENKRREENQRLIRERKRYIKLTDELQQKVRSLNRIHASKYKSVWLTREEKAKSLLQSLLDCDAGITEDILKLKRPSYDIKFTDHIGPFYHENNATKSISNRGSTSSDNISTLEKVKFSSSEDVADYYELPFSLEDILRMFLEELGFLVEDKFQQALQHLQSDDKMLPTLDLIFRVLKIEGTSDLKQFFEEFVSYLKKSGKEYQSVEDIDVSAVMKHYLQTKNAFKETSVVRENEFLFCYNDDENEKYWEKYCRVISENKVLLWKSLFGAFQKYHNILRSRDALLEQINNLKIQNMELTEILCTR